MRNIDIQTPDTRNLEPYLERGRQARADALHGFLRRAWRRLRQDSSIEPDEACLRPCLD